MPARTKPKPVHRITNADLAAGQAGLKQDIREVRDIAIEARDLAKSAGLNGHGIDIKEFFDQRAESQAARQWLNRKLQPVTRFKAFAYLVGVIASVGWAVMGANAVIGLIRQAH